MTGQNVSRRSTMFGRIVSSLTAVAAFVAVNTPAPSLAQPVPQGPYYQGTPSGSVSGDVVNFNGRGMGVLWSGGHVAGKTIGRRDSISYIGAMPYATFGDSLIFGDGRFSRTNDGGLAWNLGTGFRHYFSDVDAVFGLNGYFDRDQHTGAHFNEWGLGAELLAHNWEWRGNLYQPYGSRSEQIGVAAVPGTSRFVGTELRFDQIRSLAVSLEGYETETGFLVPGRFAAKHQIRVFGGAYHYESEGSDFNGWKARLQANLFDCLETNVQITNDDEYDTNVTFGVAMNIGGYRENAPQNNARYRLGEPVRRNYTFTTDTVRILDEGVTAMNDATGAAFDIVHVNSNAGLIQDGTVDFPFSDISLGQAAGGDIIFVHAGSEWIAGPNNEVILANDDRILGEGSIEDVNGIRTTEHFLTAAGPGSVALAASPDFIASDFALLRPLLANSAANTLTLADDIEFSGFRISASGGHGIFGSGVENLILNQNDVRGTIGDGLQLNNTEGTHQIIDTAIAGTGGVGFHVDGGDSIITFAQTQPDVDPALGRIQNSSDFAIRIRNTLEDGDITFAGGNVPLPGNPSEIVQTFAATIDDDGGTGISLEDNDGDVTIDNARLVDSTSHGINVDGGTGTFTFESSIRFLGTEIINPDLNAVNIVNLEPSGEVIFRDLISIQERGGSGFHFEANAGTITLRDNVTIDGHGVGGVGPAVSFINNQATALVHFEENLTITGMGLNGGNDLGILISGNLFDDVTGNRALFRVGTDDTNTTTINNVDGDNIQIINDAASVRFESNLAITNRGFDGTIVQPAHGILIDNSTGRISFNGFTSIDNPFDFTDSALEIRNSQANILFADLFADETLGAAGPAPAPIDGGVLLTDNFEGPLGDADIVFVNLDINTDSLGTSLTAARNSSIRVFDGTIEANPGQAVDIEDSGIDMRFTSIDSALAPIHGIRIERTFKATQSAAVDSSFVVAGQDTGGAGSGGTINNAVTTGAFLRNAGIVRLNQMEFDDNELGVDVAYTGLNDIPSPGQAERVETGLLELNTTDFEDNNTFAILGLNVPQLFISDAEYNNNGDNAAFGPQTVLLQYNEDPSGNANFESYDFPYFVEILDSEFENVSGNLVEIERLLPAAGDGREAHLLLNIQDNEFDSDVSDSLVVDWEGPLSGEINTNFFDMDNLAFTQRGIFITNENDEDFTDLDFQANRWDIDDNVFIATGERWGLLMELEGPGEIDVEGSEVLIDSDNTNGFEFDLDELTILRMRDNTITDSFFNDDTRGVFLDRIGEGSTFVFENNNITLLADDARGLEIDAFGVINLIDNGLGNTITISFQGDFEFDFAGATPNGQLLINGAFVP